MSWSYRGTDQSSSRCLWATLPQWLPHVSQAAHLMVLSTDRMLLGRHTWTFSQMVPLAVLKTFTDTMLPMTLKQLQPWPGGEGLIQPSLKASNMEVTSKSQLPLGCNLSPSLRAPTIPTLPYAMWSQLLQRTLQLGPSQVKSTSSSCLGVISQQYSNRLIKWQQIMSFTSKVQLNSYWCNSALTDLSATYTQS